MNEYTKNLLIICLIMIAFFIFGFIIGKFFLLIPRYNIVIYHNLTSYKNCYELVKLCIDYSYKNLCLMRIYGINNFNVCECNLKNCYKNVTY